MVEHALKPGNEVQFKRVPLNALTPSPHNYNQHPPAQIADLKASLIRYKQVKPVVVQQIAGGEDEYIVLAGHGITEAAKELYAENPDKYAHLNDWAIAIAPPSWSAMDAKGYLISDNETSRKAEADETLLAALLQEQANSGYDLASLGTDDEALRQMLEALGDGYLGSGEQEDEEEDEIPEAREEQTRVKLGDIWQLGRHRIACINSCDTEQVNHFLSGESVAMVWSDPPYGVEIVSANESVGGGEAYDYPFGGVKNMGTVGTISRGMKAKPILPQPKYAPVIGDNSITTAITSYQITSGLFPKAVHIWWGANYYAHALPPSSCWIVWDKENDASFFADCELAWTNQKTAVRMFRHMWNGLMKDSEKGQRRVHPTQKPIALAEWAFEKYGNDGDVIYDPFLGSGMSVIAAENLHRTVYGCELSPEYIDVIITRWEKHTGQTATLLERVEEVAHA